MNIPRKVLGVVHPLKSSCILLLAMSVLTGLLYSRAQADGAFSEFRTSEQGDWYHPIDLEEWHSLGGEPETMRSTLRLIEASEGPRRIADQPDTLIAYGPGNWIYEWTLAGQDALNLAHASSTPEEIRRHALAAMTYFNLASSPHGNTPEQRAALENSSVAYLLAASTLEETVVQDEIRHAEGSFTVYTHLPQGRGPFPTVVISNGSDQSKEFLFSYFTDHLAPKGIAMISLDMPGMGGSADYNLTEIEVDALHITTANWAQTQPQFDGRNIFLQGSSFGGNAAARAFLRSDGPDLAGVIYVCGPLDAAFLAAPEAYESLPVFTMDGVRARFGLNPVASTQELARVMRPIAISNSGFLNGTKIDTPILALNTNQDPVAPVAEMDVMLERATNATRIVVDEPGHCVDDDLEAFIASSWIAANLR